MKGSWQGDEGVLDEDFIYSDGSKERRVWRLTQLRRRPLHRHGRRRGRQAEGQAAGNALNWRYTLRLPVDGTVYDVQFDDWMFLMDERVMLNKAVMSKFGIRLGEVTLAFYREVRPDVAEPEDRRLARPRGLAGRRVHRHRPRHAPSCCTRGAPRSSSRRAMPTALDEFVAAHPGSQACALDVTDRAGACRRRGGDRARSTAASIWWCIAPAPTAPCARPTSTWTRRCATSR